MHFFAAGTVCCNADPTTGVCNNDGLFNVQAWVTTKGFWQSTRGNDAAETITPVPLATTSVFGQPLDNLNFGIIASGFPFPDNRFPTCTNPPVTGNDLRAWTSTAAPLSGDAGALYGCPIPPEGTASGDCLAYVGSSCGGSSGGSLVRTDTNEAFGIFATSRECGEASLSADLSGSGFTLIVNQAGDKGAFVESLVRAAAAPAPAGHKRRRFRPSPRVRHQE